MNTGLETSRGIHEGGDIHNTYSFPRDRVIRADEVARLQEARLKEQRFSGAVSSQSAEVARLLDNKPIIIVGLEKEEGDPLVAAAGDVLADTFRISLTTPHIKRFAARYLAPFGKESNIEVPLSDDRMDDYFIAATLASAGMTEMYAPPVAELSRDMDLRERRRHRMTMVEAEALGLHTRGSVNEVLRFDDYYNWLGIGWAKGDTFIRDDQSYFVTSEDWWGPVFSMDLLTQPDAKDFLDTLGQVTPEKLNKQLLGAGVLKEDEATRLRGEDAISPRYPFPFVRQWADARQRLENVGENLSKGITRRQLSKHLGIKDDEIADTSWDVIMAAVNEKGGEFKEHIAGWLTDAGLDEFKFQPGELAIVEEVLGETQKSLQKEYADAQLPTVELPTLKKVCENRFRERVDDTIKYMIQEYQGAGLPDDETLIGLKNLCEVDMERTEVELVVQPEDDEDNCWMLPAVRYFEEKLGIAITDDIGSSQELIRMAGRVLPVLSKATNQWEKQLDQGRQEQDEQPAEQSDEPSLPNQLPEAEDLEFLRRLTTCIQADAMRGQIAEAKKMLERKPEDDATNYWMLHEAQAVLRNPLVGLGFGSSDDLIKGYDKVIPALYRTTRSFEGRTQALVEEEEELSQLEAELIAKMKKREIELGKLNTQTEDVSEKAEQQKDDQMTSLKKELAEVQKEKQRVTFTKDNSARDFEDAMRITACIHAEGLRKKMTDSQKLAEETDFWKRVAVTVNQGVAYPSEISPYLSFGRLAHGAEVMERFLEKRGRVSDLPDEVAYLSGESQPIDELSDSLGRIRGSVEWAGDNQEQILRLDEDRVRSSTFQKDKYACELWAPFEVLDVIERNNRKLGTSPAAIRHLGKTGGNLPALKMASKRLAYEPWAKARIHQPVTSSGEIEELSRQIAQEIFRIDVDQIEDWDQVAEKLNDAFMAGNDLEVRDVYDHVGKSLVEMGFANRLIKDYGYSKEVAGQLVWPVNDLRQYGENLEGNDSRRQVRPEWQRMMAATTNADTPTIVQLDQDLQPTDHRDWIRQAGADVGMLPWLKAELIPPTEPRVRVVQQRTKGQDPSLDLPDFDKAYSILMEQYPPLPGAEHFTTVLWSRMFYNFVLGRLGTLPGQDFGAKPGKTDQRSRVTIGEPGSGKTVAYSNIFNMLRFNPELKAFMPLFLELNTGATTDNVHVGKNVDDVYYAKTEDAVICEMLRSGMTEEEADEEYGKMIGSRHWEREMKQPRVGVVCLDEFGRLFFSPKYTQHGANPFHMAMYDLNVPLSATGWYKANLSFRLPTAGGGFVDKVKIDPRGTNTEVVITPNQQALKIMGLSDIDRLRQEGWVDQSGNMIPEITPQMIIDLIGDELASRMDASSIITAPSLTSPEQIAQRFLLDDDRNPMKKVLVAASKRWGIPMKEAGASDNVVESIIYGGGLRNSRAQQGEAGVLGPYLMFNEPPVSDEGIGLLTGDLVDKARAWIGGAEVHEFIYQIPEEQIRQAVE